MKSKKVIAYKNLPQSAPVSLTLLCLTILKVWNAPDWLWGALGLMLVCIWILVIYNMIVEEETDIFKKKY